MKKLPESHGAAFAQVTFPMTLHPYFKPDTEIGLQTAPAVGAAWAVTAPNAAATIATDAIAVHVRRFTMTSCSGRGSGNEPPSAPSSGRTSLDYSPYECDAKNFAICRRFRLTTQWARQESNLRP